MILELVLMGGVIEGHYKLLLILMLMLLALSCVCASDVIILPCFYILRQSKNYIIPVLTRPPAPSCTVCDGMEPAIPQLSFLRGRLIETRGQARPA